MATVSPTLKSLRRLRWFRVCIQSRLSRKTWALSMATRWQYLDRAGVPDWQEVLWNAQGLWEAQVLPEGKAAKITHPACPHTFTGDPCLAISCLSPACSWGLPWVKRTPFLPVFLAKSYIWLSLNKSLGKLSLENPLSLTSQRTFIRPPLPTHCP